MIIKRTNAVDWSNALVMEAYVQEDETQGAWLFVMHSDILLISQPDQITLTRDDNGFNRVPSTRTMSEIQYPLAREICEIGRDHTCDIRVNSQRIDISRHHATIKHEKGRFILHDRSRHGTYVNDNLIGGPRQLISGDIVGFANTPQMLRFVDFSAELLQAPSLTDREQDVLHLVAAGRLNKEIAATLQITPNTVNTHLKNIYEKLKAHNRTEAINQARKLRLLP